MATEVMATEVTDETTNGGAVEATTAPGSLGATDVLIEDELLLEDELLVEEVSIDGMCGVY